jgi:hypothetical protein
MAGSLDIITVLQNELPQYGIPASTVSALAGISSGKLSSYLSGLNRCPAQHTIKLTTAWTSLKKLIGYAAPIPVDFRKVAKLRESLDAMENGTLQIVVIKTEANAVL